MTRTASTTRPTRAMTPRAASVAYSLVEGLPSMLRLASQYGSICLFDQANEHLLQCLLPRPQLVEPASGGDLAAVDDDGLVAGHLHLGEDVRREQHRVLLSQV